MTKSHEQMREVLRDTQDFLTECEITLHLDIAQLRILEDKIKQALATEPAPFLRLMDEEIQAVWEPLHDALCLDHRVFAKAIMDATIKKNGG